MKLERKITLLIIVVAAVLSVACTMREGEEIPPPTYAVTYHPNGADGGSVPVDSALYEFGQLVTVRGNTGHIVKNGFIFAGWSLTPAGPGAVYTEGQTFAMQSADTTLYASWLPTYTVTYDGNGATAGSAPVDAARYPSGADVTVFGNTGALAKIVADIEQVFAGWNTQADGGGTTYAPGGAFAMGAADAVLYAAWLPPYILPDEAVDVHVGARSALVDGVRAYIIEGLDFKVLDVADPLHPSVLGTVTHGFPDPRVEAQAVLNGVVWCARTSSGGYGAATHVFGVDVSDPANPLLRGALTLQAGSSLLSPVSLAYQGYLLVHDYSRNLIYIVDVSDPDIPVLFSQWGVPNMVNGGPGIMMIEGNLLYLPSGENRTLRIYDLTDLSAVFQRGWVSVPDECYGTAVKIGSRVYVTTRSTLTVVDVSDPSVPLVVRNTTPAGYLLARNGRLFAFGVGSPTVTAYSLADPAAPVAESSSIIPVPPPSTALGIYPLIYPAAAWIGDRLVGMTYGSAAAYHGLRALRFVVN